MEHSEIVATLTAAGFTHVDTLGGPLPLADWKPYGNVPGGLNYRPHFAAWRGEIIGEGLVRDLPHDEARVAPFVLGVWRFRTDAA